LRVFFHLLAAVALLSAGFPDRERTSTVRPEQRPPEIPPAIAEPAHANLIELLPAAEELPARPSGTRSRETFLKRDAVVLAITPLADVEFATIRALLPDRRVLLLGEIRKFRKADDRILVYRKPVRLPKSTRIVAQPPVPIELLLEKRGK
jgi:hypothetical protein